jgi:hypothetical protein
VSPSGGFEWLGSGKAVAAFATATFLEIGAYYIPWLDHALDAIASPLAVLAGTLVTASFIHGMDPFLKWTLAIIAGGATAGLFQGGTVALRALSTGLTAGLGNPVIATIEAILATVLAAASLLVPLLGLLLAVILGSVLVVLMIRRRKRRPAGRAG